jgi:ABC-type branched-subunit amino acid transport system ATPase component
VRQIDTAVRTVSATPDRAGASDFPGAAGSLAGPHSLDALDASGPSGAPDAVSAGLGAGTLRADRLCKSFGGLQALREATLSVPPGRITGIVGPNGAGKSTLFNILAGTAQPTSGTVSLRDADITGVPMHERAGLGIVRTFQIARELDTLTVLENLLLAAPRHPGEKLWRIFLDRAAIRRAEAEALERAHALLARVRLTALADRDAGSLSGGQKKLLELARALMLEPRIVLLDEPAAGVSPALIEELCGFILELKAEGTTFAIVEHNMDVIASLCDSVYVLAEGTVLTHGDFASVTSDERVMQAYLGY